MKERQVHRFRRRLAALLVVERGVRYLAVAGFAWGVVVLALRAGLGASRAWLFVGLAVLLAVALGVAAVQGLRSLPALSVARALVDRRQRRGGLLMAGAETDLGAWRDEIHPAPLPRLSWRSGTAWAQLAGAVVFLVVAFAVPARTPETAHRPLGVAEEIEELARDLEVLEEEGLLDTEEASRLEDELETLAEEASGDDPARTWEAFDHLREITEQLAADAAQSALTEGERLAAAMELAQALADGAGDAELLAEATTELAALTGVAAEESRLLDETLAQAIAEAARRGDLGRLREALGRGSSEMAAKLDRLYEAGLIDLETLLEAKGSLTADDETLAAYLAENGFEAAGALCQLPGRGGVDRGRGDAELTWRDPVSSDGVSFEEEILEPSSLAALERSGLIGLQAAAPSTGGRSPAPVAAPGLDPSVSGGGAAYTQTVLPRHRGAVRRFFDRKAESSTPPPEPP